MNVTKWIRSVGGAPGDSFTMATDVKMEIDFIGCETDDWPTYVMETRLKFNESCHTVPEFSVQCWYLLNLFILLVVCARWGVYVTGYNSYHEGCLTSLFITLLIFYTRVPLLRIRNEMRCNGCRVQSTLAINFDLHVLCSLIWKPSLKLSPTNDALQLLLSLLTIEIMHGVFVALTK